MILFSISNGQEGDGLETKTLGKDNEVEESSSQLVAMGRFIETDMPPFHRENKDGISFSKGNEGE